MNVMDELLTMTGIDKSFPGVKALSQAEFHLKKGEVHVLLGENGAGKSTLMKILVGIYQRDAGEVILRGKPVHFHNAKDAEKEGVSIIYQEFNLIPQLTVAENVFLGRQPKRNGVIDWKKMNRDTVAILDSLNVKIDPRAKIKTLGVAQQQMVEIAKTLSLNSEIIIMDEPTAALTETEIDSLFMTIDKLKAQGVSFIYISHRLEEIYRIGDRASIMRDGQYINTVQIADTKVDDIITMMVNRKLTEQFPREDHTAGEVILEVKNLKCGKFVKDVSFVARKGEILGFAGLMGAGRSETMRAIFGADIPESGTIKINGQEVINKNPAQAIANGIGFLTEDRKNQGLILRQSVKNNITLTNLEAVMNPLGKISYGKEDTIAKKFIKDLLIKTPGPAQKVMYLSGGNQQKVVIAKWINRNCKILIFDEPTRGIDVGAKAEIYKLMNRLVESGISIIMISSELPEVIGMSDRIYVMHEGEITAELGMKNNDQDTILKYASGARQSAAM